MSLLAIKLYIMKTLENIKEEIEDMESDLLIMEEDKTLPEQRKADAIFTQKKVIEALKWTVE